ncbi:LOW QUALITY PROTEIN: trypsin-1-like [Anopheles cruzii]|uniref:LOW QUALITY PROTEIN: trypsin-1-like n=1 Tax=Anopheles cruzii TaxID=68878 RepID=UPI0022EC6306|nr:LOW QUALITY PROTEIN: trypsin-1-like [Anopheles cruzii]
MIASVLLATDPTHDAAYQNDGERIVGGIPVDIRDFPYQVSLRRGRHFCGGSIVDHRWILTAAHCTRSGNVHNLWIRVGSTHVNEGGQLFPIDRIVHHPRQISWSDYDFALLLLDQPLNFSDTVDSLARTTAVDEQLPDGTLCKVSGWGSTHNPDESALILRAATVPLANHRKCSEVYKDIGPVTDSMICAGYTEGGKDSCQGDSGGPLVCDGQLTGVVSWSRGCAEPGFPGVYAKVSEAAEWIEQTVREQTAVGR